jgi:hypothetical protein
MKNKEYLLHIDLLIAYVHYLYTLYIQYNFFYIYLHIKLIDKILRSKLHLNYINLIVLIITSIKNVIILPLFFCD